MNAQPRNSRWLALTAGLIFLGGGILSADVSSPISKIDKTKPAQARVVDAYGRLPLTFEANQGQTDPKVKFLARGEGYGLFLTPTEAVLSLGRPDDASRALHLRWVGANPAPKVTGGEEQTGKVNYLKGNDPSGWRRNVPIYARVAYESVYPGIDLVFYGNQRQLEHDYVLAPGTDPRTIRFAFEGADRVEIDRSGELVIHLGSQEVRLHRPIAYQDGKAGRGAVPVDYRLIAKDKAEIPEVGFAVGIYDPGTALVIDPVIVYSTYFGTSHSEAASGIAIDEEGNAWVTGSISTWGPAAEHDAYLMKLGPKGALLSLTLLGGSGDESGGDVTLDRWGSIYVVGRTNSVDFPRVHPFQAPFLGTDPYDIDGFLMKLDPSGTTILYSSNLGGSGEESAGPVVVDSEGRAIVVGTTRSIDFPLVRPIPLPRPLELAAGDAYVTQVSADGSRILFSSYVGGSGEEWGAGVAVDRTGYIYLVGEVGWSPDFPLVNALKEVDLDTGDAFVAKIDPVRSSLVYCTPLGGSFIDSGADIVADAEGYVYVTGTTESTDFPTRDALQIFLNNRDLSVEEGSRASDVFLTRLDPQGELVYSTYLGGLGYDFWPSIALDSEGSVYLFGATESPDFPLRDPVDAECAPILDNGCATDVFVMKLSPSVGEILFSTYLGGSQKPEGRYHPAQDLPGDIAIDSQGSIYLAGYTYSTDFPTVNAFQTTYGDGGIDAFIAKISFNRSPDCSGATASPSMIWPPNGILVPFSIQGVIDLDGDPIALKIAEVHQDEPLTRAGVPDAAGLGTPSAQARADRAGGGDGRVYHIGFEAGDDKGATCTGTVKVCVPHDQRPDATCGDGGALFDSTAN